MTAILPPPGALASVRHRIERAGGRDVTIVAVTKGFPVAAWAAARRLGLDAVGENYAQEALAKHAEWTADSGGPPPRLHMVGRLQTNKIRLLAGVVDLWQSVDRPELVDELARRAPGAAVLVQVNGDDEPDKGGCAPIDTPRLVERARRAGLVVEGLMAVGPAGDPEAARPGFARLRALVDDMGLAVCSMGMSDDLEVAVAEGATMVRIGRALFGPRPAAMGQDQANRRQP